MDNIVIDTNSLIMAISSRGDYHRIWKSFLAGDYYLCISNEILEEYAEVIARNSSGGKWRIKTVDNSHESEYIISNQIGY